MATNNSSNNNNTDVKKTRGRQKIEMKKIEKEPNLMATFSKRRSGIYKKANELITLTGCEVGFLVFSRAGKPFTFGHPSFEDLARRYLGQQQEPPLPYDPEMFRNARIQELNHNLSELNESIDEMELEVITLSDKLEGKPQNNWWNKDVQEVGANEIADLEAAYSKVFEMVEKRRMEVSGFGNNDGGVN